MLSKKVFLDDNAWMKPYRLQTSTWKCCYKSKHSEMHKGKSCKLLRLHLGEDSQFEMKVNDIIAKSASLNETINLQKGNKKAGET